MWVVANVCRHMGTAATQCVSMVRWRQGRQCCLQQWAAKPVQHPTTRAPNRQMHTHKAHIDTQNTVPVCAALLKGLLAPKSVSLTMPFRVTRALPPLRSRCTILWGEVNVEVEVEVEVCVCVKVVVWWWLLECSKGEKGGKGGLLKATSTTTVHGYKPTLPVWCCLCSIIVN